MKFPYIFLSGTFFLATTCFAQPDIDITTLKNNKVKAVIVYDINAIESKVEECINTPSWYKPNIFDSSVFDNKGQMVFRRLYEFQNPNKYYDMKYEYNNAGLVVKTTDFDITTRKTTDSVVYNSGNLITYRKLYNHIINSLLYEAKVEYTLKKGKLPVETRTIDPAKGAVNTITIKTFDAKDRLTEEVLYMYSKEEKNRQQTKKYFYHDASASAIREIQSFRRSEAHPYFAQKFENNGFLIESVFYDSYDPAIIRSKTTYTKDNQQIVETHFDTVKEERLPASLGNADEVAPMTKEEILRPVRKRVTLLSKTGLKEITRFYNIDASGKDEYVRATKYEYLYF